MLLDGSKEADTRIKSMLHYDVNNGIARRAWAQNKGAIHAITRAQEQEVLLTITMAQQADDKIIDKLF